MLRQFLKPPDAVGQDINNLYRLFQILAHVAHKPL